MAVPKRPSLLFHRFTYEAGDLQKINLSPAPKPNRTEHAVRTAAANESRAKRGGYFKKPTLPTFRFMDGNEK